MNAQNGLFGKPSEKSIAESDARARADVDAGRIVPNADVAEWLKALGTADETPMPPKWLK